MTAGDIASLSRDSMRPAFTSALVTPSAKFVRVKPGETTVTRSFSAASSWRRPSERARTANFVPE